MRIDAMEVSGMVSATRTGDLRTGDGWNRGRKTLPEYRRKVNQDDKEDNERDVRTAGRWAEPA